MSVLLLHCWAVVGFQGADKQVSESFSVFLSLLVSSGWLHTDPN